jgi:threonine dehydratase
VIAVSSALTIADGIAVKRPSELTLSLIARWVDRIVIATEDQVAEAMVFLLERAKLVVEGAGAVGVAALLAGAAGAPEREGTTAVVLSGGNVDAGLLAHVARRHETQAGRRLVLLARVPDRPGSLARLLTLVGEQGANLLDVSHIREGIDLHVRETAVQLVLETRGSAHARDVTDAVRGAGYSEPRAMR